MSSIQSSKLHPVSNLWLILVTPVVSVVVGIFAVQNPVLGGAALIASIGGYWLWRGRPDSITLMVVFVLYSNLAAVAVQFHGVPFLAGALFPAVLGIPLFHHLVANRKEIVVPRALPWVIAFLVVQALGVPTSADPSQAFATVREFALEGLCLYVVMTNVIRTRVTLQHAVWTVVAAGLLMGSVSVCQYLTGTYSNNYGGFGQVAAPDAGFETEEGEIKQKRVSGPIGGQNRYAQVMLVLLPLAMMGIRNSRRLSWRWAFTGVSAVIGLAAALTLSRGAALAFILLMLSAVLLGYFPFRRVAVAGAVFVLIIVAMPRFSARFDIVNELVPFLSGDSPRAIRGADGSVRSRITEMAAAGLIFRDHPVLGVGPGMYNYHYREYAEKVGIRVMRKPRESHSLYLGLAAENGVLGLICFGMVVVVTLRDLRGAYWAHREQRPEWANLCAGLVLAIIAYLATAIFLHSAYIRYFWLIMALGSAAVHLSRQVPQRDATEAVL